MNRSSRKGEHRSGEQKMIKEFVLEANEGDRSPFWKSVFKKQTKTHSTL